jgi:hypothetical protein
MPIRAIPALVKWMIQIPLMRSALIFQTPRVNSLWVMYNAEQRSAGGQLE